MTERRLRQANLIGPAGYISMEDGAAPGFVQRAVDHRAGSPLGRRDGRRERRLRRQSRHRGGGARLLEGLSRAHGDVRLCEKTRMDIELQFKVQDLNARYAQAIDDNQLEAWPDFFTEDGRYRVTTAENFERGLPLGMIYATSRAMLRDRVRSLRDANVYEAQRYRHIVAPPLLTEDEGRAACARRRASWSRASCTPARPCLFATGRYEDRIVLDDGGARFRREGRDPRQPADRHAARHSAVAQVQ